MFMYSSRHDLLNVNLHQCFMFDTQGFGNSGSLRSGDRAEYLRAVFNHFKVSHPIVVSPSMSGAFSVPLLMESPQDFGGYVPVAPTTDSLSVAKAAALKVGDLTQYFVADTLYSLISLIKEWLWFFFLQFDLPGIFMKHSATTWDRLKEKYWPSIKLMFYSICQPRPCCSQEDT